MKFDKAKEVETLELEKGKVSLARFTEESRIMLQYTSLMNDKSKKLLINMKKETSERKNGGV